MECVLIPPERKAVTNLKDYLRLGGLRGLEKARSLDSGQVIETLKHSGLRGRGGAGFPTGQKWESVAKHHYPKKYVCCNGAEGEPGTFKDRYLMRKNPYQILEGVAIAAHTVKAEKAFVAVKRTFKPEIEVLTRALEELVHEGVVAKELIEISFGPDDYLFGEEKGLMEVLEGKRALPRTLPPHEEGLFRTAGSPNPTLVNNVETFANIPHILSRGADWYRSTGTPESPGTMVFTLSGDVKNPGLYELPMGTPFRELLERCGGGGLGNKPLRAAFSGVANPLLPSKKFGTPLDFDAMKKAGSGLGSGGFIVYDETACPVKIARTYSWFLSMESCGQCISCKSGCDEITKRLQSLENHSGTREDLEEIKRQLDTVENGRICYLAAEENLLIRSVCQTYWKDFLAHVGKPCASKREITLPKIEDYDESKGRFSYDTAYEGKSLEI